MKILTFKIGGIHPPEDKATDASRIIRAELPAAVTIPLKQHIGAEAAPLVAKGDHVARGQKIAEASGNVSAPVHASISGTVQAIAPAALAQGRKCMAITIAADEADRAADLEAISAEPAPRDFMQMSSQEIIAIIANKGIVGLGGATFPAAVKLDPGPGKKAELLIINACECEPCLTCDDALMRAHPAEIIAGIRVMMRAAGVEKAVIGIETNKPQAIEALRQAIGQDSDVEMRLLKPKYPQGGEKQLICAITGREVPSGGLPISVGCIVQNVGTAYAAYRAVALGEPLIERIVTIQGKGNYLAPIGMRIADLMGGDQEAQAWIGTDDADVVAGGPMMGQSVVTLDAPVVKGLSGITKFAPLPFDPDPCIRCGDCTTACPMGLEPFYISTCGRLRMLDEAQANGVLDCIECGSCSYSCPSRRPILDYIKLAKMELRKK